jgi:ABC-type long-subunit fatty acid transport system fused permease/ATPase subunit
VRSWGTIVELISVYKRLRAFEAQVAIIEASARTNPADKTTTN